MEERGFELLRNVKNTVNKSRLTVTDYDNTYVRDVCQGLLSFHL